MIVIVLCLLGILLLLIEIFLIPGITVAAVAGALFSIGGIYYAFSHLGVVAGVATVASTVLVIGIAVVYLIKSKALDTIALKTDSDSTVAPRELLPIAKGDTGVSLSRLNPMGKVKVNQIVTEGKSLGGFIDENTEIEVVKVTPTQLIVKTK